ncbi:MAG TPA: CAP domain-containing protein [Dehalococcoidia bacterium]|nr:CAP domain-containing protein [Dehalococcoidia bacterium]
MKTYDKLTTLALTAFAVVAAFVGLAIADGGATDTTSASTQLDPQEAEFMQILNAYRAQNGLGPILIDPSIQAAAEWMSADMGANNYFSHTDSNGGSPWDRMCDFGYCHNTWKGENIAAGYGTAQAVFDGWKGSPGHNANMLGQHYVVMGIALVHTPGSTFGNYWTNDFGGYNPNPDQSPPPAPTNTPTAAVTSSPSPTPTLAPTPSPTSSATPTPTTTPAPTPQPTDTPPTLADIDCDEEVTTSDVLALLHYLAGVSHDQAGSCPPVGHAGDIANLNQGAGLKGDVDCNGVVDARDAIAVLRITGSASPGSISCS